MATFGGVSFLDFFIWVPEIPFLIPPKWQFRAFWGYQKWYFQCQNKKSPENRVGKVEENKPALKFNFTVITAWNKIKIQKSCTWLALMVKPLYQVQWSERQEARDERTWELKACPSKYKIPHPKTQIHQMLICGVLLRGNLQVSTVVV